MALGTGAIDWLSISREFGGSVAGAGTNLIMTTYYGATGNIAGSGAITAAMFKGQTGLAADLGASKTLNSSGTAGTYVVTTCSIHSNGVVQLSDAVGAASTMRYNYTYENGYGTPSSMDVQWDLVSGTYWNAIPTGGGNGQKLPLNSSRTYYMLFNTAGNRDGVFTLKILANNDARVLSSMTLTHNYNIV